jgi:hypothetical protein
MHAMKLRRLALVGCSLLPLLLGCSESETVLSVNVNLSNDKMNRRATLWQPIQLHIVGSNGKTLDTQIALQLREESLNVIDASGKVVTDGTAEMKAVTEKASAVLPRFFQRVDLPGWTGSATVSATAVGAYQEKANASDAFPTTHSNFTFQSGSAASDLADADNQRYTIGVDLTPTPIEEEGVSAVFLNFSGPELEPMPAGGTGGATGGSGGGGAGGTAGATTTGGTATGGTATATGGTATATGGTATATGGTATATGGTATATGGTASTTGGTASTTGGSMAASSGGSSGGNGGTLSAGSGGASAGGGGKSQAGSN